MNMIVKPEDLNPLRGQYLRRGMSGPLVITLQQALAHCGLHTDIDGDFGPRTEKVVMLAQRHGGVEVDGKFGPDTLGVIEYAIREGEDADGNGVLDFMAGDTEEIDLKPVVSRVIACDPGSFVPSNPLSVSGLSGSLLSAANLYNDYGGFFAQRAEALGVPLATIIAIALIESGGRLNGSEGPIIRFEPHQFARALGNSHWTDHFAVKIGADASWDGKGHRMRSGSEWIQFHGKQSSEYEALRLAAQINTEAAHRAMSVGMFQIMGFNYSDLGFDSALEMFEALQSVLAQLESFFAFVCNNRKGAALAALRRGDIEGFVAIYNGSGQIRWYTDKIVPVAASLERLLLAA